MSDHAWICERCKRWKRKVPHRVIVMSEFDGECWRGNGTARLLCHGCHRQLFPNRWWLKLPIFKQIEAARLAECTRRALLPYDQRKPARR